MLYIVFHDLSDETSDFSNKATSNFTFLTIIEYCRKIEEKRIVSYCIGAHKKFEYVQHTKTDLLGLKVPYHAKMKFPLNIISNMYTLCNCTSLTIAVQSKSRNNDIWYIILFQVLTLNLTCLSDRRLR